MARGWDSYFVEIEDRKASIFLDLDPPPSEVVEALPFVLCVRVFLRSPGSHGLTTDEEFETLSAVEDDLESVSSEQLSGRYVGRYTHDGKRTFFVYVPSEETNYSALTSRLESRGYKPDAWIEPDAEWQKYHGWLYPTPEELQTIEDRRTLEALAERGDDHSIPRDVDHWIYFQSLADRASFLNDVQGEGFAVRSQWDDAEVAGRPFGVQVYRRQTVDFDTIAWTVRDLFRRAERHSGDYDGWETSVERPPHGAA
jgi:regulator of RNase E activity RraB